MHRLRRADRRGGASTLGVTIRRGDANRGLTGAGGADRVVAPLELLFDLVYVFALAELSHHLAEHVDLRTGAETLVLALAVIYAWYMMAWGANWLDPRAAVGFSCSSCFASLGIVGCDRRGVE